MTLGELTVLLRKSDPDSALVFHAGPTEIGAGYHVTELRHSSATGIDCGGTVETWQEARLQLFDGPGARHMRVGKFVGILQKSLGRLPELQDVPMLVEVAPGNRGLSLMTIGALEEGDGRVTVALEPVTALCKPAQRTAPRDVTQAGCCGQARATRQETACCA